MTFQPSHLIPVAVSFVLALVLTPLVRALARRWGAVAKPKTDRWHKKPTAMLGGVSIFLSVSAVIVAYLFLAQPIPGEALRNSHAYIWVVLGASAFLFVVGLVDDLLNAKPYQKLIGQVMGAAFVVYYGLSLPWTGSAPVNMVITIFWLIGITNAINLLDNMDGLASGIAAISSIFLAFNFLANSQPIEALVLAVFAAALIGFLVYNSNPASIFMGDCGSMFIGFFLAATSLMSAAGGRSRSFLPVLAVPILILFVPIFDTTFVTVLRKLSGRAASQGGRDHTSHRLVALGMSERRAVIMLYGFAALSGLLAMMARQISLDVSLAAILGFTVLLTLVGVYLAGVKVYDEDEVKAARDKPLFAFLIDLSYKRRIFEVLLDLVLIVLAYYGAYVLRFGSIAESKALGIFLRTLPVVLFVKMAAFLAAGIYRGIWRYTSIDDLVVFAKAVIIGSIGSMMAVLFAFRFEGVSRTVFVVDALLMLMFLAGSRMAFRLFRQVLPTPRSRADGRRALIYGAGDAGELLLREILNNQQLHYAPVGFVDDDPNKKGKVIHGFRVFGGNGSLRDVCREHRVEEVLISTSRFSEERLAEIMRDCEQEHITLKRMRIKIEQISDGEW